MSDSLFSGATLGATRLADGIVEIHLDRQGDSVNKMDAGMAADLQQAVAAAKAQDGLAGILLTSRKPTFLAGADIDALAELLEQSTAAQIDFCRTTAAALNQLADLPVPVVCAINGYALGGGLETALCADYRVLAEDAKIGFPEVDLGILPGVGGTVRTPRLTDVATALDWVVGASDHEASAALAAGVVDAVEKPDTVYDAALTWLQRAIAGELDWQGRRARRNGDFAADADAFAAARDKAAAKARHYPAGLAVVDLLERCAPLTRDQAFVEEAKTFAELAQTATAKSLLVVMRSGQAFKRRTKVWASEGRNIERAAVVGAGIMGGGVAYTSACKGISVLLKDVAQKALDLGMGESRKLLNKQVESGRLQVDKADAIQASIMPLLEYQGFDSVDVVVEAVVEDLGIKQKVLRETEAAARPGTVLASNTSSLAIADIAEPLERPQNVVGMHFFNPVHVMPLVEVVRGHASSDTAVATVVAYARAIGKTPLVVKDCAGFLINRILGAYLTAFLQLVRDGADFVQIDKVMERWGWPMGPAYLLDVAGLDTLDKALKRLGKAYADVMGTDFRTVINLLAEENRLGQKTGAGFYQYQADAKGRPRCSGDPEAANLIAQVQPDGAKEFDEDEIEDRMILAMVLEASRCLEANVAETAVEIDTGMRLGTGLPPYRGGPLWIADTLGADEVVRRCQTYRHLGGLFTPCSDLTERAGSGLRYYAADAL